MKAVQCVFALLVGADLRTMVVVDAFRSDYPLATVLGVLFLAIGIVAAAPGS